MASSKRTWIGWPTPTVRGPSGPPGNSEGSVNVRGVTVEKALVPRVVAAVGVGRHRGQRVALVVAERLGRGPGGPVGAERAGDQLAVGVAQADRAHRAAGRPHGDRRGDRLAVTAVARRDRQPGRRRRRRGRWPRRTASPPRRPRPPAAVVVDPPPPVQPATSTTSAPATAAVRTAVVPRQKPRISPASPTHQPARGPPGSRRGWQTPLLQDRREFSVTIPTRVTAVSRFTRTAQILE